MSSFKDLPDLLKSPQITAKQIEDNKIVPGTLNVDIDVGGLPSLRISQPPKEEIVQAHVRVFGKPAIPVVAELVTRSVYPVKG